MEVDITEIVNMVFQGAALLISIIVGHFVKQEQAKKAVLGAIQFALDFAKQKVQTGGMTKVEIDNQLVALAVEYLNKRFPSAIKQLGIKQEDLEEIVLSRLPSTNRS